jgi:hypothetical protein
MACPADFYRLEPPKHMIDQPVDAESEAESGSESEYRARGCRYQVKVICLSHTGSTQLISSGFQLGLPRHTRLVIQHNTSRRARITPSAPLIGLIRPPLLVTDFTEQSKANRMAFIREKSTAHRFIHAPQEAA